MSDTDLALFSRFTRHHAEVAFAEIIRRRPDLVHSAARRLGLQTMIGCMIESSVLISAAAHLAELADHLDLDGNLLVSNDPYAGATGENGLISFASAPAPTGLRVKAR